MNNPLELLTPRSLKLLSQNLQQLTRNRLWLQVLIGMLLGLVIGLVLSPDTGWVNQEISAMIGNWVALPGQIFLGLIQMIVVPLVFASIVTGLASAESLQQLKKLGLRVVLFFLLTGTTAITIGISAALIIQPGHFIDKSFNDNTSTDRADYAGDPEVVPGDIGDLPGYIVNLLPENPLGAMAEGQMLQIVLFAVIFGLALVTMPVKQAQPLLNFLSSIQQVAMTIVRWAMLLAPLAVFGLIAQTTIKVGIEVLLGMAVYVGTVIGGLLLMFAVYMLLVLLLARTSPFSFVGRIREVMLLAFSTSSSAAVMPLSIKTAEDNLNVKPSVSQFIIPLGATINMDGTALYQGVAAVFLAQVFDVELSLSALLLIVVTAVGASIGTPATPGVGIVILATILNSVGIPAAGIALILGVDRLLDMSRTAINVTGDLTACVVMNRMMEEKSS